MRSEVVFGVARPKTSPSFVDWCSDHLAGVSLNSKLSTMPNPFIHAELATTDVRKAKAFYSKLFAWKLKDLPLSSAGGTYTMVDVGDGTGGGIMKQLCPDVPSAWMPYVRVKDIDAATKKAKKLRAKIMKDVTEVEGMGWLSIIVDPTGAVLGLWEPMPR
jgi:predicted enzyme related to lactoylglutathione lyase